MGVGPVRARVPSDHRKSHLLSFDRATFLQGENIWCQIDVLEAQSPWRQSL